ARISTPSNILRRAASEKSSCFATEHSYVCDRRLSPVAIMDRPGILGSGATGGLPTSVGGRHTLVGKPPVAPHLVREPGFSDCRDPRRREDAPVFLDSALT